MSKIPFSISDRSLTFYVDGYPYSVDRSSQAWDELKDLIQVDDPDVQRLIALTEPVRLVAAAVEVAEAADYLPRGVVSVTRNDIKYNGESLEGVIVDRIFDMLAEGFDIMPMVRFLENLMQNPADFARDELYLWLESSDLPITDDGHFLAYKRTRADFTSIHDHWTDNTPGNVVSMPRQTVDPVRDHTCSRGLHFCSKHYLEQGPGQFGPGYSSGPTTVLLKINPADVVAIPSDYRNAKGRAWKYEVLKAVDSIDQKWGSVYYAGGAYDPDVEDDDTNDWDYYDDDDDGSTDPTEELLEFPSDLAAALFAAIHESGIKEHGRHAWAGLILHRPIHSFKELTLTEAGALLENLREYQAEIDAETDAAVASLNDAAEAARVDAINSYGIIALRSKASAAGLKHAWKGHNKSELRAYLIANG